MSKSPLMYVNNDSDTVKIINNKIPEQKFRKTMKQWQKVCICVDKDKTMKAKN